MDTKTSKNEQNEEEEYFCEKCDYKCFKKYNYDRHVLTDKHSKIHFGYQMDTNNEQNEQTKNIPKFICKCGKEYKYSQGLSKHKKSCNKIIETSETNDPSDKELIMMLIKENSELKHMVLDVLPMMVIIIYIKYVHFSQAVAHYQQCMLSKLIKIL